LKLNYFALMLFIIFLASACENIDYSAKIGLYFLKDKYKATLQNLGEFYTELEKRGLDKKDITLSEIDLHDINNTTLLIGATENVEIIKLIRRLNSLQSIASGLPSVIYIKLIDKNNQEFIALTSLPEKVFGKQHWHDETIYIDDINKYLNDPYCEILSMGNIMKSPFYKLTRNDILKKYFIKVNPQNNPNEEYEKWIFLREKWPEKDDAILLYILLHNGFGYSIHEGENKAYY
jgi:hypothetical protein